MRAHFKLSLIWCLGWMVFGPLALRGQEAVGGLAYLRFVNATGLPGKLFVKLDGQAKMETVRVVVDVGVLGIGTSGFLGFNGRDACRGLKPACCRSLARIFKATWASSFIWFCA